MEIREWLCIPEADKMVARWMEFFTEAYKNWMKETLQGTLTANAVTTSRAQETQKGGALPMGEWDWC